MLRLTNRSYFSLLFLSAFLILINADKSFAANSQRNSESDKTPVTAPSPATDPKPGIQQSERAQSESSNRESAKVASPNADSETARSASQSTGGGGSPVTLTPLTPGEKFKYSLRSSFKPPMPYALSALSGIFSEATDKDHGRHMSAGDFLADSATHAARSMAFRATANFFEKFAFASVLHQDPRYIRSDKHGFAKIGYALSRVLITKGDNGHNQFNASFFAGGLVTAGISNAWSRPEDRNVSSAFSRFALHVAYRGLSNVVQEMLGKR
ncbi:MAG: hypothetical protein DMF61_08695 [Blastocatellia bacterium AA13]|nr:MAG: hypothetical protein DMF61_08695 [Blastocatellia bacterium AA13]